MSLEGQSIGRYKLEQLLGSGGMGEVYLATDNAIRRQVAIKVIRTGATTYPGGDTAKDAARLFQREMRTIAMLDHPNILPLFDYGEEVLGKTTVNYMVMPYRKEGSLADWVQQQHDLLSAQDVGRFLSQAARALHYAHRQQVIHQDVKPSNFLMRSEEDRPAQPDLLLADFGVAKFTSATSSMSHTIRGTPTYMAPEQWAGSSTPATDQYALAVMSYELLAGRPPFQGGMGQMMYQHINVPPPPPSSFNSRIPREVDDVLLLALSKKPEERFVSIAAFANAFQQALQVGEAPTVARSSPVESQHLAATLAISSQEALYGANRTLTLPGGRQITITVPANAQNGQSLRLEVPGNPYANGTTDTVTITLAIVQSEEKQPPSYPQQNEERTARSNLAEAAVSPPLPAARGPANASASPQHTVPTPRRSRDKRRMLLIGLAVLVVLGSFGFYFFTRNSSVPNPYSPYGGTLAIDDSLGGNTFTWPQSADDLGSCQFTGGAYHNVNTVVQNIHACIDGTSSFTDFSYQVRMVIDKGDYGGIVFYADNTYKDYYYFRIGQDSSYEFDVVNNNVVQPLKSGSSPNINAGLNQPNEIGIVAKGSNFDLYVNLHLVDTVNDGTYTSGQVGVGACSAASNPTDVAFNSAQVWKL